MTETNRAQDWYSQAEDDFAWAADTRKSKRYAQACFAAQQSAEKALKALAIHRNFNTPRTHSVFALAQALHINGEVEAAAKYLDRFYISARYPDAYPSGYPSQFLEERDAAEALVQAERILTAVRNEFQRP